MPSTIKLRADSAADISRAADILRSGGIVAFPTETVYGLGANALDVSAVARVFAAKRRPSWDPLIVHVAGHDAIAAYVELDQETRRRTELLAERFWPGPLTLLLPRNRLIPDEVTAGRPLVGLRVPLHPTAQALLRIAAIPIAAPSANTFGHVSPTTAEHVLTDLDGRIDAVLDGGATPVGLESTVVDPTQTPIVLYRPGAVTASQIAEAAGVEVRLFSETEQPAVKPESLPSPGVGIRHYAPRARVVLAPGEQRAFFGALAAAEGHAGALRPSGWPVPDGILVEHWGKWDDASSLAANLFAGLRALDARGATIIVCPTPPAGTLYDALRDRLTKAARPL